MRHSPRSQAPELEQRDLGVLEGNEASVGRISRPTNESTPKPNLAPGSLRGRAVARALARAPREGAEAIRSGLITPRAAPAVLRQAVPNEQTAVR